MSLRSKAQTHRPFFVYGTLLPGQPNYILWGDHIISKRAATLGNGRLFDMGNYPMLVEVEGTIVRGLLIYLWPGSYHRVLKRIDALEGHDPSNPARAAFTRVSRQVRLDDGGTVEAWIYLGQMRHVAHCEPIEGGDWIKHITAQARSIESWWKNVDTVLGLHGRES